MRHKAAKHNIQHNEAPKFKPFSSLLLAEVLSNALCSIKEADVLSERLKAELNSYSYQQLDEQGDAFAELKNMCDGFLKNWDLEKFYSNYYATVPLNSTKFFGGISRNAATLLSTKVADCFVAYCKKQKNSCQSSTEIPQAKA